MTENYKEQNNKEENIISQMTFRHICLNGILSIIQIEETGKYEHLVFKETYPRTYFSIKHRDSHCEKHLREIRYRVI